MKNPINLFAGINSTLVIFGFTLFLSLGAIKTHATDRTLSTESQNGTTIRIVFDDEYNILKAVFNTSTYQCGISIWSRPWTLALNGDQVSYDDRILNGGNRTHTKTLVVNPDPGIEYSIKLVVKNSGAGTCTDKSSTVFDKTLKATVSSISSFKTTFSVSTLSASWSKGYIYTDDYTVKLSGKSIENPGAGFKTIETKTVSGSDTKTTFTGLYPGIIYKTEITQNIRGGFSKTVSDEISIPLTSNSKLSGFTVSARSNDIQLTWTNASPNIGSLSYVAIDRRLLDIGSSTQSEAKKVLVDLGKGTTNIPSSYTDVNEVSCNDHEYTLRLVFKKGSFEQTIFTTASSKISFPENLIDNPASPNSFTVSSLNTPTTCTKDIELTWFEDLPRHACQTYWFEVDRYQLDNSGNKITSSKKTVVSESGIGVDSIPVTILTKTINKYTFIDKDDSKIEGASYQYEIKTITKWPTNQTYSSSVIARSIEVGGTIDNSSVTVSAIIDPSSYIKLSWNDLSNEGSYIIRRMIGSDIDQEITVGQNITTFTDGVSGNAARCVDYTYEVLGKNECVKDGISLGIVDKGTKTTGGITNLTFIADFSTTYEGEDFLVHKGYERDFVFLEWQVAENAANIKNQKLSRKLISSTGSPTLIATLDAGTRSYTDLEAGANQLYNYYLTAETACGTVGATANQVEAVGFRTPWGLINGHVDFVGGIDVEGALISAENPAAQALNKSIYFDGDRDIAFIIDHQGIPSFINTFPETKTTDISFLQGANARTFEFWAKPESYNGGCLFYTGNNGTNPLTFFALLTPETKTSNVWNLHLGSEQLQADLAGIVAINEWHHFAVTYDGTTVKLFVDGNNLDASKKALSWERELNTADAASGKVIVLGSVQASVTSYVKNYHGYLDEFRIWDRAKTQKEIQTQKNGFLFGNEPGLQIYLRMDENYGDFLYDASYEGGDTYHRRHFLMGRSVAGNSLNFSSTIPASDQLGYNGITDAKGNYTIPYVRYRGTGEIFNVVPFIFQHSFRPSNRNLFVGQSSPVHNEQDFEDISAFKVTGTVFYGREEGNDTVPYCPAGGLFMAIDGTIALRNGVPVTTNSDGEYELMVPIGHHFISVATPGHSYITGRFPQEGTFDFQEEKSGINFVDNTQMKIVGKVVGGTTEAAKISGFGRNLNNIGQATIIFDGGVCFSDTVTTDAITGEYSVNVFPLEYTVYGGADRGDQEQFIASNPSVKFAAQTLDLRLLRPSLTETDTLFDAQGNVIDIAQLTYSLRQDYIHRVPHSLFVLDVSKKNEFTTGDEFISFVKNDGVTDTIYTDQFDHPVFTQFKPYGAYIKVTEVYSNSDNQNIIYDTVGVTDAQISIANQIADENISFDFKSLDGDSLYTFSAGKPNILMNPSAPEEGFLKKMEITSVIGNTSNTWSLDGYVLGNKPNGTSFVTEGPDIVEHILRDPPGSNSSATISKESTLTSTLSWDVGANGGTSNEILVEVGADFASGIGVAISTDISGDTRVTIETEASLSGGGDYTETVSFVEDLSTSDDPNFVGADADLFIGKSYNINFGVADYIQPIASENCGGLKECKDLIVTSTSGKTYQIGRSSNYAISPNGYDTYFIYTQRHIKTQLIPDLIRLRNEILTSSQYYTSKLSPEDSNYGKNNDNPVFGANASTTTPYEREAEDFDGPSYAFTKTFESDEVAIDSVRKFNEQIRIWEEALSLNEQQKVNANNGQSLPDVGSIGSRVINIGIDTSGALLAQESGELETNISFSSGASFSRDVSLSREVAWRFAWELNLTTNIANELGAEVNGTGIEYTNSVTIGLTQSGETSAGQTHEISYGFTLQDDDLGNFYSVDVLDGGNQNGPIFKTQGGTSSCPYEKSTLTNYYQPGTVLTPATVQFDRPAISITPANQVGIPSDEAAVYTLSLGNENLTYDQEIEYMLYLDPSSNPNGAVVEIDGQNVNRNYFLSAGAFINRQLVVRKSPQQNEYKDLRLVFQSACDDLISEEVTFSATFVPTCSNSSILTPLNQWVVNTAYNNILPITLGEYDINFSGLQKIIFRYKPSNSSQWIERTSFYNKESAGNDTLLLSQSAATTIYKWDISSLEDGNYDLQLMSVCADGTLRESAIVSGTIDRVNPHIFGRPSPADGVLSPNDEISIKFNELIDAEKIIKNLNFDVRGVLNGTPVQHYTSVGFDGNDNVSIPNLSLGNAFTYELWFNRNRTGSEEVLLQYGSITVGINASDEVYITDGTTVVTGGSSVSSDSWYHLAIAYSDETKQANVYLNGVTDIAASLAPKFENTGVLVGTTFQGKIHELRIWSDARQLTEVRLNYLNTLSGNEINLTGYWPMDEGIGTVAFDKTGRRSAIVNATWHFAQEARGVALDGINDHFEIDGSTVAFGPEEDLSLSFWFKSDNSANVTLFSTGKVDGIEFDPQAWAAYSDASGNLALYANGKSYPISGNYLDGQWHHFALSVNRIGFVNVYMDGKTTVSTSAQAFSSFAGNKIYFGTYGRYEGIVEMKENYMQGSIDEVRVWNTARQQDQIERDMRYRLRGDELALFAYFPFEQYTKDAFGQLILTPTVGDQSDKTVSGLDKVNSTLVGGAEYTDLTTAIKIERPVQVVNFSFAINGDEIIITPTDDNGRIENVTLDITVSGLLDKKGNRLASPVTWIAYVDRNQVHWLESGHKAEISPNETYQFKTTIVNSGGEEMAYQIQALPSWLSVSTSTGTLSPLSQKELTFTVQSGLPLGRSIENILLSTSFGFDEVFQLDLNLKAQAPDWTVSKENFEYSMNIIGQVSIDNIVSTNPDNMVAAIIDGEVRGVAPISDLTNGRFLVFLTIHSNSVESQPVSFRIWDSNQGLILSANTSPTISFVSEAIHGSLSAPIIIASGNEIAYNYQLRKGWNWLSLPFTFSNASPTNVLSDLNATTNDVFKGQTNFAQYEEGLDWGGSLASVNALAGYKLYVAKADNFEVVGTPIAVSSPINLVKGWNWIAYLPTVRQRINAALSGYPAIDGDLIKDQNSFAVFDEGTSRWVGTLTVMDPTKGYLLSTSQAGTLIYSNSASNGSFVRMTEATELPVAHDFQTNMSVIVTTNMVDESYECAAYHNGQLRGRVAPIEGKYYLTVHGKDGEQIDLKFENSESEIEVVQTVAYESDGVKRIALETTTIAGEAGLTTYPVPFDGVLNLQYTNIEGGTLKVAIYSLTGVELETVFVGTVSKGNHSIQHVSDLSKGAYLLKSELNGVVTVRKVVK